MSKQKKSHGHHKDRPQSIHKVSPKFAEYAESYFHSSTLEDPNSSIAKVAVASQDAQEIPRNVISKAIEKLEGYRDDEMFRALKDGEDDPRPSKAITQMIKLLKQSLTVKASGEPTKLHISENASFRQFASLKVPGGRDAYSSMRLPKLIAALGDNGEVVQSQIQNLWQERNQLDDGKDYTFTEKELAGVIRWHLRGLTVDAAVRKVRVDYEISRNCIAA